MNNNSKLILIVLISLSIIMGGYEAILYINDLYITQSLYWAWTIVFIILLVLWVMEDSKLHPEIYKPFEYGFLILIFYIPYLPYYLFKTRGAAIATVYILGFLLLFNIGWLFQWLIYWAS